MSISDESNVRKYSPSTDTTEFEWDVYYFEDTDIQVDVEDSSGVVTQLTLNASTDGFSVQATNGDRRLGATVTTTETYGDGYEITISRQVPYTQEYDLKSGAEINPTALNKAFDRTVAQSQQLEEQQGRQLLHPITDASGLTYEAPATSLRANKACGWDEAGNIVALDLTESGTVTADTSKGISISSNVISSKVDDVTVGFNAEGQHEVKDGGVGTTQYADDSLTTDKVASPTGSDTNIVTGTAGASGQLAGWNADGDVVDSGFDVTDDDNLGTSDLTIPTQGNVKSYADAVDTNAQGYAMQYAKADAANPIFDGTSPTAYADLDLSTIVGTNRAYVMMRVGHSSGSDRTAAFKPKGETNITTDRSKAAGCSATNVTVGEIAYVSIYTNSLGVLQWVTDSAQTWNIEVVLYQVLQ